MLRISLLAGVALCLAAAPQANAATVNLSGLVLNSCILTLGTAGALRVSSAGTTLSSEEVGGLAATLTIVATGVAPQINVSAPTLAASPVSYGRSPTLGLRYTSLAGGNQAYTDSSSSYTANGLLDVLTFNARALDSAGFTSGTYTIATTVTCQQ
ncbi:hypothetical protein ACFOMD_03325 [Sphingoaurantiacus capsulatus]|uniref:Spore coat protein U domain-containing protein n=1 Tax=Sphingoaurantiacus capsulatus TaxID=1771310 RepID=A0ABV7X618_9SPHN